MARREAHQLEIVDRFDRVVRRTLGLDKSIPDWTFEGFQSGLSDAKVIQSYWAYREHGVLLMPGGFLDQPPEWWDDMDTCEAIYNTRYAVRKAEKDGDTDA
jgi:hypothetical protein